jgi:hypothetical protein
MVITEVDEFFELLLIEIIITSVLVEIDFEIKSQTTDASITILIFIEPV